MDEPLIQFSMQEITRYLNNNPLSADTAEGVHQWWIQWPETQESIFITIEALNRLLNVGVVEVKRIADREIWRKTRPT